MTNSSEIISGTNFYRAWKKSVTTRLGNCWGRWLDKYDVTFADSHSSEIAIDHVCIFASDGDLLYEGPLRVEADDEWEEYTGPLKPHEKLLTGLEYYELPPPKSEAEILCAYTVEIFWSGAKEGLPLTGWATTLNVVRKATEPYDVVDIMVWRTTQMVNMEQALDSED